MKPRHRHARQSASVALVHCSLPPRRTQVDAKIGALWNACSPTARSLGGFSRDAVEGVLLSNAARRVLEAMHSDAGADMMYDRHLGSDKSAASPLPSRAPPPPPPPTHRHLPRANLHSVPAALQVRDPLHDGS